MRSAAAVNDPGSRAGAPDGHRTRSPRMASTPPPFSTKAVSASPTALAGGAVSFRMTTDRPTSASAVRSLTAITSVTKLGVLPIASARSK